MADDFVASWQRRYAEALRLLGPDTGSDPLAHIDALWLARVLPMPPENMAPGVPPTELPIRSRPATKHRSHSAVAPGEHATAVTSLRHSNAVTTTSLFTSQPGAAGEAQLKARRVPVPVADALPGRSAIERALKPFLRRRLSSRHWMVDAEATAEASANASAELLAAGAATYAIVPVLRAQPERWFDVALLVEQDEAMLAFEDTILELRDLMAHHGAFGQVRLWRFAVQGQAVIVHSPAGLPCAPRALLQSHRPQLVLLLTHGASPNWEQIALRRYVRDLAQRSLVSLVQMLPPRSWGFTALGEAGEQVRSRERGAANQQLERRDLFSGLYLRNRDAAAIPVLALEPQALGVWASWTMASGRLDHVAIALDAVRATSVDPPLSPADANADADALAREQTLRFRNVASTQAYTLLRLLAATWITLPLMRLLANTLPGPRSAAPLAEVLLSGLLQRQSPLGTPAHELVFDFVPGVREWLHGSLSSDEHRQATAAMAASRESIRRFVEKQTGMRLASFDALLLDPQGTELLPASARSFVEVSRKLRSLRGLPVGAATSADATASTASIGALHDFPLQARDLILRPKLEQHILWRVLTVPIGGRVKLSAILGSGALTLMAHVLSHPQVRHRFGGGIWFGSRPPRTEVNASAPRLVLDTGKSGGQEGAGDTLIELHWHAKHRAPDLGYFSRGEAEAWLGILGLSTTQAQRLHPLHEGIPLLLQIIGVGTTLGISRWPRVVHSGGKSIDLADRLDQRFCACATKLLRALPNAQAVGLQIMAARRPGYPATTTPLGAELAPRLGWLCSGVAGAADTLHPYIALRLEVALPKEMQQAHIAVLYELRKLRGSISSTAFASYVRNYLLTHAQAAGGVEQVRQILFDRVWLTVLLTSGATQLLQQLRQLAKRDKQLDNFTARLEQAVLAQPGADPDAQVLLDDTRVAFAPDASWRYRMAIDVAHRVNLTGAGVRIALVSSGVDIEHPEFQHLAFSGESTDSQGHGTAAASVIAGRFIGLAPGAHLWSLCPVDAQGRGGTWTTLRAFEAIAMTPPSERPDIVCLPLGMDDSVAGPLRSALEQLLKLGMLLVAAAGNDAKSKMSFPASMPGVLAVGALADDEQHALFSNTTKNGRPELWAPGTNIIVAMPMHRQVNTDDQRLQVKAGEREPPAPYLRQSGTSFSCAAVAGLAALYAEATGLRGAALGEALLRGAENKKARFSLNASSMEIDIASSTPSIPIPTPATIPAPAQTSNQAVDAFDQDDRIDYAKREVERQRRHSAERMKYFYRQVIFDNWASVEAAMGETLFSHGIFPSSPDTIKEDMITRFEKSNLASPRLINIARRLLQLKNEAAISQEPPSQANASEYNVAAQNLAKLIRELQKIS